VTTHVSMYEYVRLRFEQDSWHCGTSTRLSSYEYAMSKIPGVVVQVSCMSLYEYDLRVANTTTNKGKDLSDKSKAI
jgi:hypothetical protein